MESPQLSVAKCETFLYTGGAQNYKRFSIALRCPNIFNSGRCSNDARYWHCASCGGLLEYGFDKRFYCSCGVQDVAEYGFKCNSPNHGDLFVKYNEKDLELELLNTKVQEREEINILLLGETGVGKSTFINSIATYLTFDTFEEAKGPGASLISLIPSQFTFNERVNRKPVSFEVSTGESRNENFKDAESSTRNCRAYHIPYGNNDKLLRIIDTPGIGDTAGLEQDKANLERILKFLGKYDEIHGICLLLKPNESRLTIGFGYCFKELLTQFHISAAKNVVFCFTNASGTSYQAAETLKPLGKLLNDLKNEKGVNIDCTFEERSYAFDNMAYRYMCAFHKKHITKVDRESQYDESFDISREETIRLIQHIERLEPHEASKSTSIFLARNILFKLSKPLVKITQTLQESIMKIDQRQKLINEAKEDWNKIQNILANPFPMAHWHIEYGKKEVCAKPGCFEIQEYWGNERLQFLKCNPNACDKDPFVLHHLKNLRKNKYGNFECPKCGPNFQYQLILEWYEKDEIEKVNQVTPNINTLKSIDELKNQIEKEKQMHSEIIGERNSIVEIMANTSCYLRKEALTTYNDAAESYMEMLIESECQKSDQDIIKMGALKTLLAMLKEEKKLFSFEANGSDKKVCAKSPEEALELIEKLKSLKHYGPDVKKALEVKIDESDLMTDEPYTSYLNQYLYNKNKVRRSIARFNK